MRFAYKLPLNVMHTIFSYTPSELLANYPENEGHYYHAILTLLQRDGADDHQCALLQKWLRNWDVIEECFFSRLNDNDTKQVVDTLANQMINFQSNSLLKLLCERVIMKIMKWEDTHADRLISQVLAQDTLTINPRLIDFLQVFDHKFLKENIDSIVEALTISNQGLTGSLMLNLSHIFRGGRFEAIDFTRNCLAICMVARKLNPDQIHACVSSLTMRIQQPFNEHQNYRQNAYTALAELAPFTDEEDSRSILKVIRVDSPESLQKTLKGLAGRCTANDLISVYQREAVHFHRLAEVKLRAFIKALSDCCQDAQVENYLNFHLSNLHAPMNPSLLVAITSLIPRLSHERKNQMLSEFFTVQPEEISREQAMTRARLLSALVPHCTPSPQMTSIIDKLINEIVNSNDPFWEFTTLPIFAKHLKGDQFLPILNIVFAALFKGETRLLGSSVLALSELAAFCPEEHLENFCMRMALFTSDLREFHIIRVMPVNDIPYITKTLGILLEKSKNEQHSELFALMNSIQPLMANECSSEALCKGIKNLSQIQIESFFAEALKLLNEAILLQENDPLLTGALHACSKLSSIIPSSMRAEFITAISRFVNDASNQINKQNAITALCALIKSSPEQITAIVIKYMASSEMREDLIFETLAKSNQPISAEQYNLILKKIKYLWSTHRVFYPKNCNILEWTVRCAKHCEPSQVKPLITLLISKLDPLPPISEYSYVEELKSLVAEQLIALLPYCDRETVLQLANPPAEANLHVLSLGLVARTYCNTQGIEYLPREEQESSSQSCTLM